MARKPNAEFDITATDRASAVMRRVDSSLGSLSRTAVVAERTLGALISARALAEFAQFSDRYNQLATRIRTATRETGDFQKVQASLLATSISTGTALEDSVETFQALSRVREDIGATNDQMLTLTKTVQQIGVIGGTSSEALSNGLRQFNQAIAAGVFRAEEFNSIVENTPELAKRLADGFGVTQGQLRQMVLDGKLFATDVINVLLAQAPEISAQFEEIPSNLDRAFTALSASIGSTVSELDSAVGVTATLADKIQGAASGIAAIGNNLKAVKISEEITQLQDLIEGKATPSLGERIMDFLGLGEEFAAQGLLPGAEEKIRARIKQLQGELADLTSGGGGSTELLSKITDSAIEVSPKALALAAKHYEALLGAEETYLAQQRELQIRGAQELAAAIAEEEAAIQADELARALGFEDAKAQAIYDRKEEIFRAGLEARERQFEEELAIELGYQDTRQQALAEQEAEHNQRMLAARAGFNRIAQAQATFLTKFETATAKQKSLVLLQEGQSLLQGMTGTSKAAFEIQKGLALAEAVISAQGAAVAAWEKGMQIGGPPVAAAFTGLSLARTAAMIAAISSTSFQGGVSGGGGGGSGGGGISYPASQDVLRDIPVVSSEQRNTARIELTLNANTGDDVTEALVRNIRAKVDQGDAVLISSRSRQAIELGP